MRALLYNHPKEGSPLQKISWLILALGCVELAAVRRSHPSVFLLRTTG